MIIGAIIYATIGWIVFRIYRDGYQPGERLFFSILAAVFWLPVFLILLGLFAYLHFSFRPKKSVP